MKRFEIISLLSLTIFWGAILFSACGVSNNPLKPDERLSSVDKDSRSSEESNQNTPVATGTAEFGKPDSNLILTETSPQAQNTPLIAGTDPTPTVKVKTELEASDPSTVQLAAGKPQLVEFFAFW